MGSGFSTAHWKSTSILVCQGGPMSAIEVSHLVLGLLCCWFFQIVNLKTTPKLSPRLNFHHIKFIAKNKSEKYIFLNRFFFCPGWRGSVGWWSSCEPEGHRLDSCSGHVPGLWALCSAPSGCLHKAEGRRQPINVSLSHQCLLLFLPPFPFL